MSWIVEDYLINKEQIKSTRDINSDDYLNVMIIEKVIDTLNKRELLTPKENQILQLRSEGYSFSEIGVALGIGRITVSVLFGYSCDKISYILGGYFTDDGYLDYLMDKYHFSNEMMAKIDSYIHSAQRHRMKRTNFLYNKG
jgi:hypothetical protein